MARAVNERAKAIISAQFILLLLQPAGISLRGRETWEIACEWVSS